MSVYGVYLIGLGQIGQGYDYDLGDDVVYTHARALSRDARFRLLGAVDPSADRRAAFSRRYGLPAFAEASELPGPADGVVIASPTPHHLESIRVAAPLARRFLLAEKPLGVSAKETAACVKLAEEAGVPLFVNYVRRTDPAAIAVKQVIASGSLGAFRKGTLWYTKGLRNSASHFINLIELWLGEASSARAIAAGREYLRDVEPDFYFRVSGGEIYGLAARDENFTYQQLELCFDGGVVRYFKGGEQVEIWLAQDRSFGAAPRTIEHDLKRYQQRVYDAIARQLAGGPSCGLEARYALATSETVAAIESSREAI